MQKIKATIIMTFSIIQKKYTFPQKKVAKTFEMRNDDFVPLQRQNKRAAPPDLKTHPTPPHREGAELLLH